MHDGSGEETQAKHQARGPDEQHGAVHRLFEDIARDAWNPAIRAKLDVTDQGVHHEQHGHHPVAK